MATRIPTDAALPTLRDVLSGTGDPSRPVRAALAVDSTRPRWPRWWHSFKGRLGLKSALAFHLANSPHGSVDVARAAFAPWLSDMRYAGLSVCACALENLLARICPLRLVRADSFFLYNESFRFLTVSLWRIARALESLGVRESDAMALANTLAAEVSREKGTRGAVSDPPAALLRTLEDLQGRLDRLEILWLAAVEVTREARVVGEECDLLMSLPATDTTEMIRTRVDREKTLLELLERVHARVDGHGLERL